MIFISRLIFLSLFLISANIFVLARDSVNIKFDDKSVFKGCVSNQGDDSLYVGTLYSSDLHQYTGFWYNDFTPKNILYISFNGDSFLFNKHKLSFINDRIECYGSAEYRVYNGLGAMKYYDYEENYWYTIDYYRDRYNKESSILEPVEDESDSVFISIIHFLAFSLALFLLLQPVSGDGKGKLPIIYSLILSVLLIILYYIFTTKYLRSQLVCPMMGFFLPYALKFFIRGIKHVIAHIVLSGIILVFWSWFLFFYLDEVVCMSDGTPVNVQWQTGTGTLKRHVVKKIIANLLPVKVRDHDADYVVYVSKYELSREEFDVINDELFAWIGYLLREEPLYGYSYREARIILGRFKEISNVDFDFLSYNEWKSATLGKKHEATRSITDLLDVDEGVPNECGLVNFTSNLPEYTSTYLVSHRLGLSADTLISEYNHVLVVGNAYTSDYAVDYSAVDKDLRDGFVGLRLIYRPESIGARIFFIQGIAVDGASAEFPKNIILESYNGVSVLDLPDYESFQEMVIEERFNAKSMIVYDIYDNQRIELEIPAGQELYDFIPHFIFEGVNK